MPFRKTPAAIARALSERDYKKATPVQAAVLESEADERDLLVSAQTGSGKTVAYGLAIAPTLLDGAETLGRPGKPLALIIAPTRELAIQVQRELTWLYQYAGARITACVGGMDPMRERRQLADGVHIVVGTPGRLRDHIERRALDVSGLKAVVLDEADEMLDLGFREDLQFILETTPETRRTLLFSATLPKPIVAMARDYQRDALRIQTVSESRGHADIEYRVIRTPFHQSESVVVNLLRYLDPPSALVFCATRNAVRHLEAILKERGFSAVALSGELSQHERNTALQALRDGRARVCVATDVAARGIDLPNLGLVIHADLPNDAEVLQHRSGRTGRAGKKGISILLVPNSRRRKAEEMLGRARVQFTFSDPPSADDIRALDRERLLQNPIFSEENSEDDMTMADNLLSAHDPRAVAAAFVKLYRAQFPAPEEIQDDGRGGRDRGERGPRERGNREDRSPRPDRDRSNDRGPRHEGPRHEGPRHDSPRSDGPRGDRAPKERAPRVEMQNGVWFKVTVGRERNADPKWLLPEICRQGEITKKEIGSIRVYDTETRFEVDSSVAAKFADLVATRTKGGVRIFSAPDGNPPTTRDTRDTAPSEDASEQRGSYEQRPPRENREGVERPKHFAKKPHRKGGFGKPHDGKPRGDKPYEAKPYEAKAHGDASRSEKPFTPHDGKPHDGKPRGAKPFGKPFGKPHDGKPRGDKPFGKPFGKSDGSKPPFKKNKFKGKPKRD